MLKSAIRYGIAACIACGLATAPIYAAMADSKEYLVKAAFLYNFVKFVSWPDGKAISNVSKIDVCIIGSSPLSEAGSVFKAASTNKLALSLVEEHNWRNAASHCHIAFIGSSEEGHLGEILSGLRGQPVLTVSDMDDFAEHGGMIGFVTSDNKIKVAVNTKAAAASRLRIDAQLLEIALKVIDK